MRNLVVWVDIPVHDFERAKAFYELLTGLPIVGANIGDSRMGFFLSEGSANGVALIENPNAVPSREGVIVYLNGGDDLQPMLDLVEPAGGRIEAAKTKISAEHGCFAMFYDTEGNRLGIWSTN